MATAADRFANNLNFGALGKATLHGRDGHPQHC